MTDGASDASALTPSEKELLDDSLRVITLSLGYLDGAETLAEHMRAQGKPGWQYLAYQHLAEDYLDKERYLDSVNTGKRSLTKIHWIYVLRMRTSA